VQRAEYRWTIFRSSLASISTVNFLSKIKRQTLLSSSLRLGKPIWLPNSVSSDSIFIIVVFRKDGYSKYLWICSHIGVGLR